MRILITAGELLERRIWSAFRELRGVSRWAGPGWVDSKKRFELSEDEARHLGLLKEAG